MSDPTVLREREQERRGKSWRPKRPRPPARAVLAPDGSRVLAVLHGHGITQADLDQVRACLLSAPNRTAELEAFRG